MLNDEQHLPWSQQGTLDTIGAHAGQRAPLLPVRLGLQEKLGFVDPRAGPCYRPAHLPGAAGRGRLRVR